MVNTRFSQENCLNSIYFKVGQTAMRVQKKKHPFTYDVIERHWPQFCDNYNIEVKKKSESKYFKSPNVGEISTYYVKDEIIDGIIKELRLPEIKEILFSLLSPNRPFFKMTRESSKPEPEVAVIPKSIVKTVSNASNGVLELCPISVNEEYCKEWNERMTDFVVLTRNGELISNNLYRIGGIGTKPDNGNYFMLLKYVEDYYPEHITKHTKSDPKHLAGLWCILDKNGVEKVVFKQFESPYLVKDSCIYSIDRNYYNIETGEFYCEAYKNMESTEFLFLDNPYDKDLSKKGVMKINKKDGSWSVFK